MPSNGEIPFVIEELRLYQTPNLLLEFEGLTTISAPDPKTAQWKASNLIYHLASRTSGNSFLPLIDKASNRASYESCYKTSHVELGPLGDKMVITINLSKPFFIHSLLVVQDLFDGVNPGNHNKPEEFL